MDKPQRVKQAWDLFLTECWQIGHSKMKALKTVRGSIGEQIVKIEGTELFERQKSYKIDVAFDAVDTGSKNERFVLTIMFTNFENPVQTITYVLPYKGITEIPRAEIFNNRQLLLSLLEDEMNNQNDPEYIYREYNI